MKIIKFWSVIFYPFSVFLKKIDLEKANFSHARKLDPGTSILRKLVAYDIAHAGGWSLLTILTDNMPYNDHFMIFFT